MWPCWFPFFWHSEIRLTFFCYQPQKPCTGYFIGLSSSRTFAKISRSCDVGQGMWGDSRRRSSRVSGTFFSFFFHTLLTSNYNWTTPTATTSTTHENPSDGYNDVTTRPPKWPRRVKPPLKRWQQLEEQQQEGLEARHVANPGKFFFFTLLKTFYLQIATSSTTILAHPRE